MGLVLFTPNEFVTCAGTPKALKNLALRKTAALAAMNKETCPLFTRPALARPV